MEVRRRPSPRTVKARNRLLSSKTFLHSSVVRLVTGSNDGMDVVVIGGDVVASQLPCSHGLRLPLFDAFP